MPVTRFVWTTPHASGPINWPFMTEEKSGYELKLCRLDVSWTRCDEGVRLEAQHG